MTSSKTLASLSPRLLARKGGAKPAMRQHVAPLEAPLAGEWDDNDLGWNDMGEPADAAENTVVPLGRIERLNVDAPAPEVVRQREQLSDRLVAPVAPLSGRRVAFTLRLDGERHRLLRLAGAIAGRSGQNLLTQAIDRYFETMPELQDVPRRNLQP